MNTDKRGDLSDASRSSPEGLPSWVGLHGPRPILALCHGHTPRAFPSPWALRCTTAPASLWGAVFTGFGQEYDPAPKLIKFFVTSLLAPPAALLIQITSRGSVKYESDKYAALLCGSDTAIGVLSKLRDQESWEVNPSHAPLFIANPLTEDEIYNTLFCTRPSIGDRIKRLEEAGY